MARRKKNLDVSLLFENDVCAFCGIGEDNEVLYGKYIKSEDICMHSNCMFFASGLCQRGKDENVGFAGFLLQDIKAELLRGKKLQCTHCRKRGATIGCCNKKCKKSFHLPCGIKHYSLHQFFGTFPSFCKDHSPKQKKVEVNDNLKCHICCEEISTEELNSCLYSPCCKNSWFHKLCLQQYALSAGLYFFKCPLCNNSNEFVAEMKTYGICIPDKDASWELEENAYQDLLHRPHCDATNCRCPKGRRYTSKFKSGWSLISCSYCGSHARHKACGKIKLSIDIWVCHECKILEQQIHKNKVSSQSNVNSSVKLECEMESSVTEEIDVDSRAVDNASSSTSVCPSSSYYTADSVHSNKVSSDSSANSIINLECDMEDSVPEEIDIDSRAVDEASSSSTSVYPLSPYCISGNNICNISKSECNISLIPVCSNSTQILNNVDLINVVENGKVKCEIKNKCEIKSLGENVKHGIKNTTSKKSSEGYEQHGNTAENIKYSSPTKKSKLSIQDKPVMNLKDIKNITPNALEALRMPRIAVKKPTLKKAKKKKTEHICNTSNHCCCIRRYFGQECGKYRL